MILVSGLLLVMLLYISSIGCWLVIIRLIVFSSLVLKECVCVYMVVEVV